MRLLFALIALTACVPLAGCSGERTVATAERTQVVYVVRRAWHSGVAISVADLEKRDWPLLSSFAGARYVEFGWGDAAYYQADEPTSGMTMAAVLWPTPTVMEVVPLQNPPAQPAEDYYTVAVHISPAEVDAILASIDKSFVQPVSPTGKTYQTAAGEARFYNARGMFHAFRMCNRWTGELLQLAGCAVKPALMMTAGQVMGAAKRCDAESAAHNPRS